MTVKPFARQARQFCQPAKHSWVLHQFRGTAGFRNLRICEHCGRTHVVLSVDKEQLGEPVHAAANPAA
jgi:hypothetical protein